jgi:hypothetical protein
MMRPTILAAAAALWLAAPAAAQPDPEVLAQAAFERMLANQGSADAYTLVLRNGDTRVPVYVYRDDEGWSTEMPSRAPLGELFDLAVIWPGMLDAVEEDDELKAGLEEAGYMGTEEVDGRQAHVLRVVVSEGADGLDSMRLYVDVESSQLLRMTAFGLMDDSGGELIGDGAALHLSLDLGDYTAFDGVVVPRKMRVRMRMGLQLSPEERQEFQEELDQALAELEGEQFPEAGEVRMLMEVYARLLLEGEVDLPVTVEEVRVNSGPPEWLEAATIDDPGA